MDSINQTTAHPPSCHTPDSYRDSKEKDTETGYSYPSTGSGRRFGARYYDSVPIAIGIRVWLSVDPMSDERPSTSPFAYCQNNPIMLIDPTGMLDTDFGVKKNGEVTQIGLTNNEPDRLYAINDDGTKKSEKHITVNDKNLLPSLTKADPSKKEGDYWAGQVQMTSYNTATKETTITYQYKKFLQLYYGTTKSSSDAKKVFMFAAQNSTAEWGLRKNKSGLWIVGTLRAGSQAPTFNDVSGFKFENILFDAHSHGGKSPDYDFVPSSNDIRNARNLKKTNSTSQIWLYMPQNPQLIWINLGEY